VSYACRSGDFDRALQFNSMPLTVVKSKRRNSAAVKVVDVHADLRPNSGLPNTFVPGRNLIFLTYAAAFAYPRDIRHLVIGVAQTDYSGYPDCREHTISSLQKTIRLGMDNDITIHAPLMHRSKKETVELAIALGALDVMAMTHTCYNGKRPPCGTCPACQLRAKGFAEAGAEDPLLTNS